MRAVPTPWRTAAHRLAHSLDLYHCCCCFPSDHGFESGVVFAGTRTATLCCFSIFMEVLGLFLCCDQFR